MTDETWKVYGSWYPTAELRWRSGKLKQVWRREFEQRHRGGVVMGGSGHEDELREVPCCDDPMAECSCDWETGECQAPLGCKAFAENERLRAALKPFAAIPLWRDQYPDGPEVFPGTSSHLLGTITPEQVRAARNALEQKGNE